MEILKSSLVKNMQIINDKTGEIETTTFVEKKTSKTIKGGWNMTYAEGYDLIMLELTNRRETLLMLGIKSMFSKSQVRVTISPTALANKTQYSRQFVSKTVTKLVGLDLLMQLPDRTYLLNPFIIIPSMGDAETLQREWMVIRKSKNFTRRGEDVIDNYKRYKLLKSTCTFKQYYAKLQNGTETLTYGRVVKP